MRWVVLALLIACKGEKAPEPGAGSSRKPAGELRVIADAKDATLVAGTRRIALRSGEHWYESTPDGLVEAPLGAAIAKEPEIIDVFLGATPIVLAGAEHAEVHVRFRPARAAIQIDGVLTEVATTQSGIEVWRYDHEIYSQVAVVDDRAEALPAIERIGPDAPARSPVSKRMCERPRVIDIDAAGETVYALVTECSDEAPIRIISYEFPGPTTRERTLPSQKALGFVVQHLAVSRTGQATLVGVAGSQLGIVLATDKPSVTPYLDNVTRVLAAVVADDGAVWTLTLGGGGGRVLARDGQNQALDAESLAVDENLGVVVVAGEKLYALRGARGK